MKSLVCTTVWPHWVFNFQNKSPPTEIIEKLRYLSPSSASVILSQVQSQQPTVLLLAVVTKVCQIGGTLEFTIISRGRLIKNVFLQCNTEGFRFFPVTAAIRLCNSSGVVSVYNNTHRPIFSHYPRDNRTNLPLQGRF